MNPLHPSSSCGLCRDRWPMRFLNRSLDYARNDASSCRRRLNCTLRCRLGSEAKHPKGVDEPCHGDGRANHEFSAKSASKNLRAQKKLKNLYPYHISTYKFTISNFRSIFGQNAQVSSKGRGTKESKKSEKGVKGEKGGKSKKVRRVRKVRE